MLTAATLRHLYRRGDGFITDAAVETKKKKIDNNSHRPSTVSHGDLVCFCENVSVLNQKSPTDFYGSPFRNLTNSPRSETLEITFFFFTNEQIYDFGNS